VIKAEINARSGKPTPSPAVTGPVSLDPGQVAREITFDSVSTEFQTLRVILLDEDGVSARLEGKAKLLRQLRLEARAIDDLSAAFPAYVRLDHVNQTGNDIGLKGVATSLQAIAEAMAKLQQSALFPSVELRSTTEEKNAVRFELGVTVRGSSTAHK
jgi:Tfp pilus assembly protein PilN